MVVDHSHRHEMDIEPTAVLAVGGQPMQPVTQQQIHIVHKSTPGSPPGPLPNHAALAMLNSSAESFSVDDLSNLIL